MVSVHRKHRPAAFFSLYTNDRDRKNQYTAQFRKWQWKKNLEKDEWKYIGKQVAKRRAVGKESEVYHNGRLISAVRLKKEIPRYVQPSYPPGM
jgi:hypothetical protein